MHNKAAERGSAQETDLAVRRLKDESLCVLHFGYHLIVGDARGLVFVLLPAAGGPTAALSRASPFAD